MQTLRSLGSAVGEYVGGGRGEAETAASSSSSPPPPSVDVVLNQESMTNHWMRRIAVMTHTLFCSCMIVRQLASVFTLMTSQTLQQR